MWRWRPGVFLCLVGTALALWFVVLNAVTAWAALPDVLHGTRVDVVVADCAGGTCHGTYRLAGVAHTGKNVLGLGSARTGSVVRATVDAASPGSATVDNPTVAFAEAVALAVVGAAVFLLGLRALARAWRRRGTQERTDGDGRPRPAPAADDDPLAWARRRRFGAGD